MRHLPFAEVGFGAIRAALLFGSAAVAIALIATPLLDRNTRNQDAVIRLAAESGLDTTVTGSVERPAAGRYTIHRSVLQPSPSAVCIIRDDGSRTGAC